MRRDFLPPIAIFALLILLASGVLARQPFLSVQTGVTVGGTDTNPPQWDPAISSLAASQIDSNSLMLTWTGLTDDVAVTGYSVYQDGRIIASLGNLSSYLVTGLVAGSTHTFNVEGRDAAGNWSSQGPTLTLTTPGTVDTTIVEVQSGTNRLVDLTSSRLNVTLTLNVTSPVALEITRLSSSTTVAPPGLSALGIFFEVTPNQTGTVQDARIRVFYNEAQAQEINENSLSVYVYVPGQNQWSELERVFRNTIEHWVEGTVHHISIFGVFGQTVSHAVESEASSCWYCTWWLWVGAGGAGAGSGTLYLIRRRPKTSD